MRIRTRLAVAITLCGTHLFASCNDDITAPSAPSSAPLPVITEVTPTTVVAGEIVTISGSNFGDDPAAVTVMFGTRTGEVLSVIPTSISARVPNNVSGNLQVALSIGGRTAVGPTLTVILSNPVITGVTPTTVVAGEIITISGNNFGDDWAAVTVTFGTRTGEVLSVTPTSIAARVPNDVSGNLPVAVSIGGRTAVGPTLTVILNNPIITGVTPTTVVAGEIITISGNFGDDRAAVTVRFGTRTGEVLSVTPTSISARVPNNVSGSLPVAVSIGGRTAVGPTLTVIRRVAGSFNVTASVGSGPCGPIDLFDLEGIANSFEGQWSIQQDGVQLIVTHGTRSWTGVLSGNMFEDKTNPPGLGSGGLQLAFRSTGFGGVFTLAFGSTCQNTINLAGIRASFN